MTRRTRATGVLAAGNAEFRKVWASRVPQMILTILPFACFLFAFELFHVEKVTERLTHPGALEVLGLLYFASWKTLLLPATMITFAAYWASVDSQYGMIRVAACQPMTRTAYLVGKWIAIGAWVAIFTSAFVGILVIWTLAYQGPQGLGVFEWATIGRFGLEVVVFVLSLSMVAAAAASFRTTVGAALVTAMLSMIALGFATMVPFEVLPPKFVLARYFFFALGELPMPAEMTGDSPWLRMFTVADFGLTAVLTPLVVLVPALIYFNRRSVSE